MFPAALLPSKPLPPTLPKPPPPRLILTFEPVSDFVSSFPFISVCLRGAKPPPDLLTSRPSFTKVSCDESLCLSSDWSVFFCAEDSVSGGIKGGVGGRLGGGA